MSMKELTPGQWLLDIRLWRRGKEYRKYEKCTGGKKAADARAHEIRKELAARAEKEPCSLTINTFKNIIEYYLTRNAIDTDSQSYFNRLVDDLGDVPVSETRERFDKYLLLLRRTKSRNTGRPLSNQTINHYLKWSKAAFNFAVRAGVTDKNPLQYFQKLPTYPRDRLLSEDEKERLIEAVQAEAPHIYPIVLFSLMVPCRRGELLSLKRTDYNMVTNTIHVQAKTTKMKRPAIKPVPDCLTEYFRSIPPECPYLFYRRKGMKYYPLGDFRKAWKRCLLLAGIENYRFHDQRRGAYTDLLLKGNAPHIVMQVSGHATDMSKVYFGRNEMLAAKSIFFGKNGKTEPEKLKTVTA